jgi:hypothetical protein
MTIATNMAAKSVWKARNACKARRDVDAEISGPRDPSHIWLRQSVTFSANGQTRTVEISLPLRPGATPGEVAALLDEADAGMRSLSRRLDTYVTTLMAPGAAASLEAPSSPPAIVPPPSSAIHREPATGATHATAYDAPEMSLKEFIEEIKAIDLTPPQAMRRLGVTSLASLNLREALETLHRQALLEGAATPELPVPPVAPAPLAFEEEEDADALASEPELELSYPDPASLPGAEDQDEELAGAEPPEPTPSLETLRHDARLTSAAKLPPPAPRRASSTPAELVEAPTPEPEETPVERATRMLGELRALNGVGAPSDHQHAAFKNVVVSELSERGVDALTRAVWNVAPDAMGPEQFDALISWGKRDHFKDEAREVLKIARVTPLPQPVPPAETLPPAQEQSVEPTPPTRSGRGGTRARAATSAESADEPQGGR